jgi:hypothetical protein
MKQDGRNFLIKHRLASDDILEKTWWRQSYVAAKQVTLGDLVSINVAHDANITRMLRANQNKQPT